METTEPDIRDVLPRVRERKERRERLEQAASEARAALSKRREVLDDVETITAYAEEMSQFLATGSGARRSSPPTSRSANGCRSSATRSSPPRCSTASATTHASAPRAALPTGRVTERRPDQRRTQHQERQQRSWRRSGSTSER